MQYKGIAMAIPFSVSDLTRKKCYCNFCKAALN
jgi:hypothetical protein